MSEEATRQYAPLKARGSMRSEKDGRKVKKISRLMVKESLRTRAMWLTREEPVHRTGRLKAQEIIL